VRKGIANDPLRKEKIARAALDLLAESGVRGATHRTIAVRAGVPLGSVTYHYASLDDIFVAAFEQMAQDMEPRYDQSIIDAGSQEEARDVLVDAVCGSRRATQRELRLHRELYAYGTNSPRVQDLIRAAEQRSIDALSTHFPEPAARALDALVEGWWIYQSWNPDKPLDRSMVVEAVDALSGASARQSDDTTDERFGRKLGQAWPER
jgi:DNA-binding transcriptional regulator YbjK